MFLLVLLATPCLAWQSPLIRTAATHPLNAFLLHAVQRDQDWSVADNWDSLSTENPYNSAPDSRDIYNQDIAGNAASSILPDNHDETVEQLSPEDQWIQEQVETIQSPMRMGEVLYDTGLEKSTSQMDAQQLAREQQKVFEDKMGDEISMLIRCNEEPKDMLVRAGRALPELTTEQKRDPAQLVAWKEDKGSKGHWEATPFLKQAVSTMFHLYAQRDDTQDDSTLYMDAKGVSLWMTRSLGSELDMITDRERQRNKMGISSLAPKRMVVGRHDPDVLKTLAKYATYGTGKLTVGNFLNVYMDAITKTEHGVTLVGSAETLSLRNADRIGHVWRDLANHDILPPVEQQYEQEALKLEKKYGSVTQQTQRLLEQGSFVDECEILDYSPNEQPASIGVAPPVGATDTDKNLKYILKSSHEKIELASDKKTPLHMKDGDFVFIDEESCIGCMQCVNAAPDSFLMLESGRARSFVQRTGPDVSQGVAACPVSCMHHVSFDELQELETVRDKGDGRDDHQHMGHRRGHTPLYVRGIDSDNNHRSSWYHYMKGKCVSSGQCPQRGCYACPSYKPGENPHFKQRVKDAIHTRAQHFIDTGAADIFRKTAEL